MSPQTIAEIPFVKRPVHELLHLDDGRELPSRDYAGFGWAVVPVLWLENECDRTQCGVRDALVLALHSADDGESMLEDIELEFECPEGAVAALASSFLAHWLPRLPPASTIVLALCNPHRAALRVPVGITAPLYYGLGDVASWREITDREPDRIILTADQWRQFPPTNRSKPISPSTC